MLRRDMSHVMAVDLHKIQAPLSVRQFLSRHPFIVDELLVFRET